MHCLSQFDLASEFMEEPDAVEMALWFHDAIYDPKKSDNEEKSAELFRGLAGGRADLRFTHKVINLIINTTHREWPYSQDGQLTVDIDLSSLGLPWEVFKNNSRAIRNEYAHLSDKKFAHQQDRFFKSLLSRSSVFASAYFKERYESVARNNIKRLMAKSLGADGSFL
jgi:predicted metal-dependent HD superfamily phosphohydrolase